MTAARRGQTQRPVWRGPARGALRAGQGLAGPAGRKKGGPGRGVRTKAPNEASSPPPTPTRARPRLRGGEARRQAGPSPLLIIFHDEHVIMSCTRNNQFGIAALMS